MSQASLLADQLDAKWRELEEAEPTKDGGLTVMGLPVGDRDELLLGVGGGRHLLIPLPPGAHRAFHEDRRGVAVHLRLRPGESHGAHLWYADLVGLRASLDHVFAPFCADVIARIASGEHDAIPVLRAALASWRSLFASGERRLSTRELAGLYGELEVLVRLLERDERATRLWLGPLHGLHDFSDDHTAVEVKATLSDGDDRKVHIHHLNQLEPPVDGSLSVAFFRLDANIDEGMTVPELVARAFELGNEQTLTTRLESGGYHQAHAEHYGRTRFVVLEEIWFEVDSTFPRLQSSFIGGALPEWASNLVYQLDLSAAAQCAMTDEAVQLRVQALCPDD